MDLQAQLEELKETTQAKLAEMHGDHAKELQELRVQVLGKKGSLTELLKGLKELSHDMRPVVGKQVNEVRDVLTKAFEEQAKIVMEAASYANEFEVELWEEAAAEAKEKAEAMGVQFYYPDIKPFQEKMKDLHAEYTQDESMKAVYDKIRQKGDEILAKNASVESGK